VFCIHSTFSHLTQKNTTHTHPHTHTHKQSFYGSLGFVQHYLNEPVPEETFTHSHLLWSSVIPPSITIHGILPVQFTCQRVLSTTSLQVFFGLPLSLAPSTSYSIHFFTQSLPSFRNTCPCHRNLFRCSSKIMSYIPSLSLNSILGTQSFTLTPYIHLTILTSAC